MSGVECPSPPHRTSVPVSDGRAWRAWKIVSAAWRTAETQITMQSTGALDEMSLMT